MKTFVIKLMLIIFSVFVLYKSTVSYEIKQLTQKSEFFTDKSNREKFKDKLIGELKKASEKEFYFNEEERIIISKFLYVWFKTDFIDCFIYSFFL